jgi:hypothetical protein
MLGYPTQQGIRARRRELASLPRAGAGGGRWPARDLLTFSTAGAARSGGGPTNARSSRRRRVDRRAPQLPRAGRVLAAKYADRTVAEHGFSRRERVLGHDACGAAMEAAARMGGRSWRWRPPLRAYRRLVWEDAAFEAWFRAATPIAEPSALVPGVATGRSWRLPEAGRREPIRPPSDLGGIAAPPSVGLHGPRRGSAGGFGRATRRD